MNKNEKVNEERVTNFFLKKINQYRIFDNTNIKITKEDLISFVEYMETLDKLPSYQENEDVEYSDFGVITLDSKDTENSKKDSSLFTEIDVSLGVFCKKTIGFF